MDDYDPHDHRITGAGVVSAWMTAVIVVLVMAVTVTLAEPVGLPAHGHMAWMAQ